LFELIFCNIYRWYGEVHEFVVNWMPLWGGAVMLHGMYAQEHEFEQLGSCNLKL